MANRTGVKYKDFIFAQLKFRAVLSPSIQRLEKPSNYLTTKQSNEANKTIDH